MPKICLATLLMMTCCLLVACATQRSPAPRASEAQPEKQPPVKTPPVRDSEEDRWNDSLLAVAADFRRYTKLSDDPAWAPTMCRSPLPTGPFKSRATTKKAHGRKLYYLWVKDSDAYQWAVSDESMGPNTQLVVPPQPVGQALVKESYHPANPDGKDRALGEAASLFVMLKFDASTDGTDAGWIYGTLTPDGKEVTSAGLIESCMDCHDAAGDERLFGPPISDFRVPRTPPKDD